MASFLTEIKKEMRRLPRDPNKYPKHRVLEVETRAAPGIKSITFKAIVKGSGKDNYITFVQFLKIPFSEEKGGKFTVPVTVAKTLQYHQLPNILQHPVRLKCSCQDFRFVWEKPLFDEKSLIGNFRRYTRVAGSNAPRRNPSDYIGFCFTGDTKISLLNGTEVPIKDLVGKEEFWVYSCTPEGKIVPGRGHSCKLTRKDSKLVKIILDNKKEIRCTPDHRFMLKDGSYKEAQFLLPEDSLMPLYRRENHRGYEEFFDNESQKWGQTHRRVAYLSLKGEIKGCWEDIKDSNKPDKRLVVHHKGITNPNNKRDNSPENLKWMGERDHFIWHSENMKEKFKNPVFRRNVAEAARKRFLTNNPMSNPSTEKRIHDATRKAHKRMLANGTHNFLINHPMRNPEIAKIVGKKNSVIIKEKIRKGTYHLQINNFENNPMKDPEVVLKSNKKKVLNRIFSLLKKGIEVNKETYTTKGVPGWNFIAKYFGSQKSAIEQAKIVNHKIVSIEYITETEDVYDITVDEHHNFALSSGVFVHNCKHTWSLLNALEKSGAISETPEVTPASQRKLKQTRKRVDPSARRQKRRR